MLKNNLFQLYAISSFNALVPLFYSDKCKQTSFTLYPARSMRNSGSNACWVTKLNAALCLDSRAKKIEVSILINNSFPRVGIELITSPFYSHALCPCATTVLKILINYNLFTRVGTEPTIAVIKVTRLCSLGNLSLLEKYLGVRYLDRWYGNKGPQ